MAKTSRKKLFFGLRLTLTVGALTGLLYFIGWDPIMQVMRSAIPKWVLLTYAATFSALLTSAALLRRLLSHVGLGVTFLRIMLANALSTFYTLIMPGDMFAGVAKWADLSAATGDKSRVLSAMVFSKIGLSLAPLVIGSAALAVENPFQTWVITFAAMAVTIVLVTITALFLNARAGRAIGTVFEMLIRWLPEFLQSKVQSVATAFAEFRSLHLRDAVIVLVYSLAAFVVGVLAMAFAAKAVGVDVPTKVFVWVSMILFITRLIPITISNLGIREGVLISAFGLYGVEPAMAFATGMVMFSATVLIAIAGALYQIAIASGWIQWRAP